MTKEKAIEYYFEIHKPPSYVEEYQFNAAFNKMMRTPINKLIKEMKQELTKTQFNTFVEKIKMK